MEQIYSNQIMEYDPVTDRLVTKGTVMPTGRYLAASVWSLRTNKAYVFGGRDGDFSDSNQILEYDPTTDRLAVKAATLPTAKENFSSVWSPVTNKAYIFGGHSIPDQQPSNQILEYDPVADTVVIKGATLPTARFGTSSVWSPVTNKAYIFGGWTRGSTTFENQILEYDPVTDRIVIKSATLPGDRVYASSVWSTSANKAYIFGGAGGQITGGSTALDQILEYDPVADRVVIRPEKLPSGRYETSSIWSPTRNKAYIFGGYGSTGFLDQILEFDPACAPAPSPSPSPSPSNNAACQSAVVPSTVTAGSSFGASVTMRNTGTKPWTSDATPHGLARNGPITWGVTSPRALPSSPINPNGLAAFTFTATAPTTPGTYPFAWQMTETGVETRFGAECPTQPFNITVTAPTPSPSPSPTPTPTPPPTPVSPWYPWGVFREVFPGR